MNNTQIDQRARLNIAPDSRHSFTLAVAVMLLFSATANCAFGDVGVGAKPIEGAEMLFDGSREMLDQKWTYWKGPRFSSSLPIKWKIVPDPVNEGTVVMTDDPAAAGGKYGTADVVTKELHRDFRLHVEFLVRKPGGNSGVYLQNRFEIQVLDGDKTRHGMGAVINETPSPYHAYNGLGKWNSYDIVFRAARFENGKRKSNPLVTMYFNGVKVHTNQTINQVWGGPNSGIDGGNDGGKGITDTPGGLKLQCEGHQVLYRNIWIKHLDLDQADTDFVEFKNEWRTAAGKLAEGKLESFLGKPEFEMQQIFKGERFPNIVAAVDGSVVATWGTSSIKARRSENGGKTWGDEILIAKPGFQGGGMIVDEKQGDILSFVESQHPPADLTVYRSKDHGKSWLADSATRINPDANGNVPSMHMNEHGITLRHGRHKGRIIRPSRWYAGKNDKSLWSKHYTNAIYSDDGGLTWDTSAPFPANGTGEATLVELSDGRIYYNSRRHWAPEGVSPLRRWHAWSMDGGQTWEQISMCQALPDGPQDTNYGCMAGLVRLPVHGLDILVYSNCDSPAGRVQGTVWISFDGGMSWPLKRLVYEGNFAYSSLTAGRPETSSDGWIYLNFEGGPDGGGSTVARFNLSWVLEGDATGDGQLPEWVKQ